MGDLTLGVEGLREGIQGRDSALPASTTYYFRVWYRRGAKYENRKEMHVTF